MADSQLFHPTYLKELCHTYGLVPSKRYGQHFLISGKPIQETVAAAQLKKTDTVIEIGPGFGVLTFALAEKAKKVIAFEIEKKLVPYWELKQRAYPHVEIVWGNALKELPLHVPKGAYTVAANLPYQITSHIIRTLLELPRQPTRMVCMVQKEVAERIVTKKGDMNLLGLSVQYYGTPRIVAHVPKGSFWPQPQVDSTIIAIDNIHFEEYAPLFFQYARAGFASKRKQLWKNIASAFGLTDVKVKKALEQVAGDARVRAEDLSTQEWKEFSFLLDSPVVHRGNDKQ